MCLTDLTKAFDRVQIQEMIDLLYDRSIPVDIIKTVESIYKDNKIIARLDGETMESIA